MSHRIRRAFAALAAGAALALLGACAEPVPEVTEPPAPEAPLPVLSLEQQDAVLAQVGEAMSTADASLDPEAFAPRIAGAAAEMRQAAYALQTASDGEILPEPFTADSQVTVVGATDGWPRAFMAVTFEPEGGTVPLILGLRQEDPRDPYVLVGWSRLLPGVETPSVAAPAIGSAQLPPDAGGLLTTPVDTLAHFADVLGNPESEFAGEFAEDPYRPLLQSEREQLAEGVEEAGEVEVSATAGDPIVAFQTADGGALVMGSIDQTVVLRKTVDGATLELGGEVAVLGGSEEVETSATAVYRQTVTFYVPPAGTEAQTQLIGAERVLMSVTRE